MSFFALDGFVFSIKLNFPLSIPEPFIFDCSLVSKMLIIKPLTFSHFFCIRNKQLNLMIELIGNRTFEA